MKRLIEQKLIAWKKDSNRKPLIVDGVRQVGKTHTLLEFGKRFNKCHYFNFEEDPTLKEFFETDLKPERILQDLSVYKGTSIDAMNDFIFFDEIQECSKALTSLKYFNEQTPEIAVCSAGSLLGVYLNRGSFPVGKVDLLNLRPLSFEEFLLALGEDKLVLAMKGFVKGSFPAAYHVKLWDFLKHYFVVGGLPEAVVTYVKNRSDYVTAFNEVRKIQKNIFNEYLADMSKHSGKVNAMHLDRILEAVPEQLSKEQDSSTKRFRFRGVVPNVKEYTRLAGAIDWLEKQG